MCLYQPNVLVRGVGKGGSVSIFQLFFTAGSCPIRIHIRVVFNDGCYNLGQKMSNKLSMCQLTTGKWREVQVTHREEDDMPSKGYGQSMVIHQGLLYVYTGNS